MNEVSSQHSWGLSKGVSAAGPRTAASPLGSERSPQGCKLSGRPSHGSPRSATLGWPFLAPGPPHRSANAPLQKQRTEPGLRPEHDKVTSKFPTAQRWLFVPACPLGIATSRPTGAAELPGNGVGFCFVLFLFFFLIIYSRMAPLAWQESDSELPWKPPPKVTMSHRPACPLGRLPTVAKTKTKAHNTHFQKHTLLE